MDVKQQREFMGRTRRPEATGRLAFAASGALDRDRTALIQRSGRDAFAGEAMLPPLRTVVEHHNTNGGPEHPAVAEVSLGLGVSTAVVHTPLISTDLFEQVQSNIKVRGTNGEAGRARRSTTRPYLFRGLLRCGLCGRVMTGNPNHGRNYYRCKASRDYVHQHGIDHPPVLYLREDAITDPVDVFLHQELSGSRLAASLRKLADAQHRQVAERDAGAPLLRDDQARHAHRPDHYHGVDEPV